jgi:hypothetical protein
MKQAASTPIEQARESVPDDAGDVKALAAELVRDASNRLRKHAEDERTRELVRASAEYARSGRLPAQLSQTQLRTLTDAVEQDLRQPRDTGNVEERLARLETAMRVLAQAVITMTETARVAVPAVPALKTGMPETDVRSAPDDVASPSAKTG